MCTGAHEDRSRIDQVVGLDEMKRQSAVRDDWNWGHFGVGVET